MWIIEFNQGFDFTWFLLIGLVSCISTVDGVPCRIAFERGKERHFQFLALSMGSSGWLVLVEESLGKPGRGLVRVVAPLAGCNVSCYDLKNVITLISDKILTLLPTIKSQCMNEWMIVRNYRWTMFTERLRVVNTWNNIEAFRWLIT